MSNTTFPKGWLMRALKSTEKQVAKRELDELRYQIPVAEHAAEAAEDYVHKLKQKQRRLLRLLDEGNDHG